MMSREPDETMIHPKSSDGLIKRVPRTLIQGLRREWHSSALAFAGNKAHLRSISPAVSAHFPSPSRDFPRPFAFRIAYFSNRGNVESTVDTFKRKRDSSNSFDCILSLDCINIWRISRDRFTSGSISRAMTSFRCEWVGITSETFEKELWCGFNLLVSRLTLNHLV